MKVKEIISFCKPQWIPGRDYPGEQPQLSVILPTFRRGKDGLFSRVARSILSQSLRSLELIIIDDASTDGTADLIAELMAVDGRVSCIRHQVNMGLPAISEFEGFLRARAPVIGFAFDDFVFEPDALGLLLNLMRLRGCEAIHGEGRMPYNGRDEILGDASAPHDKLLHCNFIANGAVMISAAAIREVGLYDPHIVLSRLCDWDLWRRLRRKYSFHAAPFLIGREYGASRSDSLGNTYPTRFDVIQEFMGWYRDSMLTPDAFLERDVLSLPKDSSYQLRRHAEELKEFFCKKAWYPKANTRSSIKQALSRQPSNARRNVSIVGWLSASATLYWVDEPGSELDYATVIEPDVHPAVADPLIARSDLVIFVRELMQPGHQRILALCRYLNIPHVYFGDDNFPVLAQSNSAWRAYHSSSFKRELETFEGVIVSSDALAKSFKEMSLHPRIDVIHPIFLKSEFKKLSRAAVQPPSSNPLDIVCFGGRFRTQSLLKKVLPALDQLSKPVRLYTRPFTHATVPRHIEWIELPESPYFFRFLKTWRSVNPAVVVHPAGRSTNIDYKSENAIIVSLYLGAVPVLTNELAYADYDAKSGVEKVDDNVDSWRGAIDRLGDPAYRAEMLARLLETCSTRFTGQKQIELINSYLAQRPPLEAEDFEYRYRLMLPGVGDAPQWTEKVGSDGLCILSFSDSSTNPVDADAALADQCGFFEDVLDGNIIKGWAQSEVNSPSTLSLEIDGTPLGTFSAQIHRADLAAAGVRDGHAAFLVRIPQIFLDDERHVVSIKFANGKDLEGSPKEEILRAE